MERYWIFLAFLLTTIYYSGNAQINDDFNDGNFTDIPSWSGEKSSFMVNQNGELQLSAPSAAGQSYLCAESNIINNAEWNFYVKLDFNPSSSNYIDIYLVSDSLNLSGQVRGYFVRIGSTQDELSLSKQSGDKSTITKIIDGMDDRVDLSSVALNIKVTKSNENTWELFVDPSLDQTFISEGTFMDGEHFFSNYFGVKCTYTFYKIG